MFTIYEPIDPSEQVSPGIVITAWRDGLPLRYGILNSDGNVIAKVAESKALDCSRFNISEVDWLSFVKDADHLYRCEESTEYSYSGSISRAEKALGTLVEGLYSVVGDDFAYFCLTGNYASPDSNIYGEHLTVHFDEFGILKAKHHAIGIENGYVLHFTDVEEGKAKPLSGLIINITTYEKFENDFGVPVKYPYPSETVGDKVITRNRAVNCWALQNFGDYGLFTNNCIVDPNFRTAV